MRLTCLGEICRYSTTGHVIILQCCPKMNQNVSVSVTNVPMSSNISEAKTQSLQSLLMADNLFLQIVTIIVNVVYLI